eukprot:gene13678-biopygen11264
MVSQGFPFHRILLHGGTVAAGNADLPLGSQESPYGITRAQQGARQQDHRHRGAVFVMVVFPLVSGGSGFTVFRFFLAGRIRAGNADFTKVLAWFRVRVFFGRVHRLRFQLASFLPRYMLRCRRAVRGVRRMPRQQGGRLCGLLDERQHNELLVLVRGSLEVHHMLGCSCGRVGVSEGHPHLEGIVLGQPGVTRAHGAQWVGWRV